MKNTHNRLIIFCLVMIIILTITGLSEGAPEIVGAAVFTENMGPNSAGLIPGYLFIFSAIVSDPLGVPNNIISVTAIALNQDQQDYTLSSTSPGPIFQGLYQLLPKPDYDGQIGEWIVKVTNKQNESYTMITNNLDKPRLIPLIENIRFSDSSTTPTISWNPVLFDDDLNPSTPDVEVDGYKIRFLKNVDDQFYRSDLISGTTFKVPASILVPGETVFVRIEARDHDQENNSNELENISDTFATFTPIGNQPPPADVLFIQNFTNAMKNNDSEAVETALNDLLSSGLETDQTVQALFEGINQAVNTAVLNEKEKWDVDGDGKIGLEEAINALQVTSGIRIQP